MLKMILEAVLIVFAFIGVISIIYILLKRILKFTKPTNILAVVPVCDNDQNLEYTVRLLIKDMSAGKSTYTDICLLDINANDTTKQIMEILDRENDRIILADKDNVCDKILGLFDLQTK